MLWIWIGFLTLILGLWPSTWASFTAKTTSSKRARPLLVRDLGRYCTAFLRFYLLRLPEPLDGHWPQARPDRPRSDRRPRRGHQYLTGYVIEKSLSVDNIFVIALLFTYFAIPRYISTASCSGESSGQSSCEGS
jgi:hypothetical protein